MTYVDFNTALIKLVMVIFGKALLGNLFNLTGINKTYIKGFIQF